MTFRPTTIERAYELARSGTCATIGEVKSKLHQEGFTNVQDKLYGPTMSRALKELCKANFKPSEADADAA